MINSFRGPEVKVLVGKAKKPYFLSKNLVCHYSKYFDAVFNSGFEESETQVLDLNTCTTDVFDLAVAYMWTGDLKIPMNCFFQTDEKIDVLTLAVNFFLFADYINLHGDFTVFGQRVKQILGLGHVKQTSCLTAEHIRDAERLPKGHALRTLFANSCLEAYTLSVQRTQGGEIRKRFKFWEELEDLDGFAADISRAYTKSMRGGA